MAPVARLEAGVPGMHGCICLPVAPEGGRLRGRGEPGVTPLVSTATGRDAPGAAAWRPRRDTPGARGTWLEPQEAGCSEGDPAFGGKVGLGAVSLQSLAGAEGLRPSHRSC